MFGTVAAATAQDLPIPDDLADDAALESAMPVLASTMVARYGALPAPDLSELFRAQLVARVYRDAIDNLQKLRAPLASNSSPRINARYLEFLLYAESMLQSADKQIPFDAAYRDVFRMLIEPLNNRTSAVVTNGLSFDNLSQAQRALNEDLERIKGTSSISPAAAATLIRDYGEREMHRALGPMSTELIAEDDAHRYLIDRDVAVATPDGSIVCALIVRPAQQATLPALLQFTIYNDPGTLFREARRAASNGYVGVMALTRGKGCSPATIVPYEHDGADAAAVVDWIAAQPWSDGRVGMYGGSYSGFTPWAAAKYRPKALKAIMVGAPNAPGIDSPMEGNVFWNFIYPWPFYTTNNKTLDNATYGDAARWSRLDGRWYASGRAYRDLDRIDGTPNPIFDHWLEHPAYDAFWQRLIPFKQDFAAIDIPVLETAGYYFGGPGAAVYYLSQHRLYRPDAQDYLVIGPYDHFMAQRGTATAEGDVDTVSGYKLDAAALIDMVELRFRWFDYVLKGQAKPAILADKINFEVTGANAWRHAPSIAAMANARSRFYLAAGAEHSASLSSVRSATPYIRQTVDFADRRDADSPAVGGDVQDKNLDSANGTVFISEPFGQAIEMSGLFSGRLDFIANRRDFDFQISLYELTADGQYIQLAPFWSRASFVGDLSHRRLLSPGKRQSFAFRSSRLMSRKLGANSRLVAVLSVIKESGRQINYGTGGDVSAETLADAQVPLRITWFTSSFIDLPIWKN